MNTLDYIFKRLNTCERACSRVIKQNRELRGTLVLLSVGALLLTGMVCKQGSKIEQLEAREEE